MQRQTQKRKRKRDRGARSLAQTRSLTCRLRKRVRRLKGRYILTKSTPKTRIGDRAKRSTQSLSIFTVRTSGTFFLARSTAQVSRMLKGQQSISRGWAMDRGQAVDPVNGRCPKQSRKWEYESLDVTRRRVGGTTRPSSSHRGKATIRKSAATIAIVLSMGRSTILVVIQIQVQDNSPKVLKTLSCPRTRSTSRCTRVRETMLEYRIVGNSLLNRRASYILFRGSYTKPTGPVTAPGTR